MPDRSRRAAGILFLLVTSVGWGLNWPAMKFLLTEWPPLFARGLSGLVAAAFVAGIAVRRGESLRVQRALLARVAAHALLNVFAWMGFATLALQWLAAGQGAMLVYTMPVWAMLLAWPIAGKRPHAGGVLALAACLAGLAILLGARGAAFASSQWPGVAFALLAAVAFALGTVALRPLPLGAFASLAWQLVLGCAPMLAYGIAVERPDLRALSATGVAAMAYMTVFAMGICYLSWFAALRRLPPATAATGTLVTPVVGVVSGALALGEPLGPTQWIAMALVLGGVGLALRQR
jgi:drug/metabolite transporter (DMT)-like permease